jgi:hypothetical protein
MTSFEFTESQYRFTSPIRYFKANDPVYYEVDNIPLKQLHENDLWLKDQIFNLKLSTEGGVERQNINELRPYVAGSDNVVKVKPGRFTARINDAYSITPLQVIQKVAGDAVDAYNVWTAESISSSNISAIVQAFKQAVAINLNGLVERAFTRPAFIPDTADTTYTSPIQPKINLITGTERDTGQPPYPGAGAILWNNFNDSRNSQLPSTSYFIRQYDPFQATIGFSRLGSAESAFIKRWRGIARTAVVDVPSELSIEVPRFNEEDYFYYNEQGVKVYLTAASQRVDLLFIYSKPVDTSSVTIGKYANGSPSVITKAELGIVYGAGLGVNFQQLSSRIQQVLDANGVDKNFPGTDDSTLPDGTIKMLAHFGDELGQNTGFGTSGSTIRGSFPAPDDLMNISPLLDESLSTSSITLVGQSVLPIAYIIVKKNANLNSEGVPVISSSDVIDIRPFFRTTELSYNERAGIAAAVPAPSIANPIVTQAELDFELKKVRTDVISRIPTIPDIPRPSYQTVYVSSTEDITLDTPILIFQGKSEPLIVGTKENPNEIFIAQDVLPLAAADRFPNSGSEPQDVYRSFLSDIIIRCEGIHADSGDAEPQTLFISVVDGLAPISNKGRFIKAGRAGSWIRNGNAEGYAYGAIPGSMNIFSMKVPSTRTSSFTPPTFPLTVRTYGSREVLSDLPSGYTNTIDFYGQEGVTLSKASETAINYLTPGGRGGNLVQFKVYIIGYKLTKVSRFKGIAMD